VMRFWVGCGAVLEPVVDALSPIASFVSTISG
jgi:hypothetical protein